jgi:MarR family transcriptional regulator, negative regulator of the multidrug operon emrRAB
MSYAHKRLENLLGAAVLALADEMGRAIEEAAGQGGGAPAALVQLSDHPGLTVDGLRRRIKLTHSAAVRLLDRLVDRGLARRSHGVKDARTTVLTLTEDGEATAAAIRAVRAAVLSRAISGIPEDELEGFETALDHMLHALPRTEDDTIHYCRLCYLEMCPAEACPVEQRYLELIRLIRSGDNHARQSLVLATEPASDSLKDLLEKDAGLLE